MLNLFSKANLVFKFLGIASILGCAGSQSFILPSKYSIKLNDHGGMMPYGTTIFLSNTQECYVDFFIDGLKSKISISPKKEDLDALVKYMHDQKFSKIKSREMEVFDRGGNVVNAEFDGQKIRVSNMGFHFIKNRWSGNYSNIVNRIFEIAKKYLSHKLQIVEIEIDDSLIKEEWRTSFSINNFVFIEWKIHSKEKEFQPKYKVPMIPGDNISYVSILKGNSKNSRGSSILNWNEIISISPEIKKIKFTLIDGDIQITLSTV